jgi:hypothetical protein
MEKPFNCLTLNKLNSYTQSSKKLLNNVNKIHVSRNNNKTLNMKF